MRRRMFWTIAGVAAVTGLLVLVGSVFASQRAAVDATYREMKQSSDEAVAIIEDAAGRVEGRPGAAFDLFRLLEGDLGPLLTRIRRTAGGSEIGFAVVTPAGEFRSESGLFDRIDLDEHRVGEGLSQFTRSTSDELVVVTPALIPVRTGDATVLVGIARDAPVVRVADQTLAFVLIIVGIALLSGLLARLLSSQLADRLKPLATTSRELADGDLSARVPDLQDPELNEVASAFNDMAGELEATQRREREFILGVGHDLRTPLTTIGGYAEALETGQVDGDDLGRIGAVLGVQSRQLSRLIEDLSTLARLEQPEFSLRMEQMDIAAHVREIAEGFQRRADEFEVGLTLVPAEELLVATDPDRVAQIVQNLIENALRFTPETGDVRVAVSGSEGDVSIEVSDTGLGIAPEDLALVFDRHFVGQQRQIRNEGSGLGLSIVKGLVDRMGGQVTAQSTLGKGTTIRVLLPR